MSLRRFLLLLNPNGFVDRVAVAPETSSGGPTHRPIVIFWVVILTQSRVGVFLRYRSILIIIQIRPDTL